MKERGTNPLVYVLGALVAVTIIVTLSARLSTLVTCGAWPARFGLLDGMKSLSGAPAAQTATGCSGGQAATITVLVVFLLLSAAIVAAGLFAWMRWRESDRYFVRDLRGRRGFAQAAEIAKRLSAKAVRNRTSALRPGLPRRAAQATDVAWKVGSSRGTDVHVLIEDSVVVVGPPRSGKGYRLIINAILDWPGPLVTTSTRNDNIAATYAARKAMGQAIVFDPQQLSGIRNTVKVSPITGCDDPLIATQRSAALVAGTGLKADGSNAEWAAAARDVLAALLMAAAVDHRTVADLARWGSNPSLAQEAVDILEQSGDDGWASSLDANLHGDAKILHSKWLGVEGATAPLRIPQLAESMTPRPGERVFDPQEFLADRNTLYLIGTKSGAGAAGGYLVALLDDLVETARRRALTLPGSRLDPPLGLILDEIVNIFSWPALPTIMADGGGIGISPLVVLQARTQAETAWSRAEMESVFSAATAKIVLGGSTDGAFLRDMEQILGKRDIERRSTSYNSDSTSVQIAREQRELMTADEMRRMPESLGLLSYRNMRPVLLDLAKWTDRDDAKTVQAGKRETEAEQQDTFSQQFGGLQ